MGIGIGIFLIALGAILTFAVDWKVGGLDLHAVGWILMAAGVGGLLLFLYFWNRRRTPEAVTTMRQRRTADVARTYDDPTAATNSKGDHGDAADSASSTDHQSAATPRHSGGDRSCRRLFAWPADGRQTTPQRPQLRFSRAS